jgi:hypothetical protein
MPTLQAKPASTRGKIQLDFIFNHSNKQKNKKYRVKF